MQSRALRDRAVAPVEVSERASKIPQIDSNPELKNYVGLIHSTSVVGPTSSRVKDGSTVSDPAPYPCARSPSGGLPTSAAFPSLFRLPS